MMDQAIAPVGLGAPVMAKNQILSLVAVIINKKQKLFIAIKPPVFENGLVSVKGNYVNKSEAEVKENYLDYSQKMDKKDEISVQFPLTNVSYIQALTYKAN